jgi:hypothetical protein
MRFTLSLLIVLIATACVRAVTIDTVIVGDPGNAGDVQTQGIFGAVAYNYRIGKY